MALVFIRHSVLLVVLVVCTLGLRAQQIITVRFPPASSELSPAAYPTLDAMASVIRGDMLTDIHINGYCDATEPDDSQHTLAIRRAASVQAYLLSKHLQGVTFILKGYGRAFPVDSNRDEHAYAKNRRAEIVINMTLPPAGEEVITSAMRKPDSGQVFQFPQIHFYPGTAEFLPGSAPMLLQILRMMQKYPDLKIEIGGHTCCEDLIKAQREAIKRLPLSQYDSMLIDLRTNTDTISRYRALAVVDFLVANGIEPSRIKAIGYGGKKPLVVEYSEADRVINRRIEVKVISKTDSR